MDVTVTGPRVIAMSYAGWMTISRREFARLGAAPYLPVGRRRSSRLRLEHLRWGAAHRLRGWDRDGQDGPVRPEKAMDLAAVVPGDRVSGVGSLDETQIGCQVAAAAKTGSAADALEVIEDR